MTTEVQYRVADITLADRNTATPKGDVAGRLVITADAPLPIVGPVDVVVTSAVFPAATASATGAWLNYSSGTALIGAAGLVIGGGVPGRLRSIMGVSTAAATDYYLVGVNKNSAPVAGDATLFAIPLQDTASNWAGSSNGLDFGPEGMYFSAGIAYAISTTPQVVTLAAVPNSFTVFARYLV